MFSGNGNSKVLRTNGPTDRQTWVGARDACASKNNWGPLSSTFHIEQPGTLIEWNFKSMTYGLTWVGARDACASKKFGPKIFVLVFLLIKKIILLVFFYIYKIYSHHVLDGYTK